MKVDHNKKKFTKLEFIAKYNNMPHIMGCFNIEFCIKIVNLAPLKINKEIPDINSAQQKKNY